jgi:glycosyltransferase involved in cell wall biosynthesis
MRILAVGNMYPPHHLGGYELMWQAADDHARSRGHEVRVLASDHRERSVQEPDAAGVFRTLRWYWSWERYEFPELSVRERVRLERANAAELRRHLADFRPDVVAWWAMGCMSLSLIEQVRRAGVAAVFSVHDDWLVYGWKADKWIRIWRGRRRAVAGVAERVLGLPTSVDLAAAGKLLFNSAYTQQRASSAGIDTRGSAIIHPGVDERYLQAAEPCAWGWRLLYVGRLDRQKGVDVAVEALAHLPPESTLKICGSGDDAYTAELQQRAAELGIDDRVSFEGLLDAHELHERYAQADVVVFPVRWEEPWGLVPLEAMGRGRLVISTARGGTAEFVRDGDNALVMPLDDAPALARCVERLAAEEGLRERLRDAGLRTAAAHTLGEFAARTVAEIELAAGVVA